jgi:hypothetical protein
MPYIAVEGVRNSKFRGGVHHVANIRRRLGASLTPLPTLVSCGGLKLLRVLIDDLY